MLTVTLSFNSNEAQVEFYKAQGVELVTDIVEKVFNVVPRADEDSAIDVRVIARINSHQTPDVGVLVEAPPTLGMRLRAKGRAKRVQKYLEADLDERNDAGLSVSVNLPQQRVFIDSPQVLPESNRNIAHRAKTS